jgi:hypothetical protein
VAAARYASSAGYRIGIAVYDTQNHTLHGSGSYKSTFASESIIKTFIAARLLVRGEMYGTTERMAYKMITQSDDYMATALYGRVGGDALIDWVKSHFHVPDLGSRPIRAGWWGSTRITPAGLVKFYAKVKASKRVGPWLLNAMHHATTYGSDGTYQFFGLPSATSHPAVKQGWGGDYDYTTACFNTTGFVNGDRYAVAILARGPYSSYGSRIGAMLTAAAKRLLPKGVYPAPLPNITGLSRHAGATTGNQRVTVTGTDFTRVTEVVFGTVRGSDLHVLSPRRLTVVLPKQRAATLHVYVHTNHGGSARNRVSTFTYAPPPVITALSRSSAPLAGRTRVTITGTHLGQVRRVLFGTTPAQIADGPTAGSITVVAPAHAAGTTDVRVLTIYGRSPLRAADRFTYLAAPTITGLSPTAGPGAGGSQVTITGTGFTADAIVRFVTAAGTTRASVVSASPTSIVVTTPPGSGPADVTVTTAGGTSAPAHFTYR